MFSTTVFLYFAILIPSIAFGMLNDYNTHGKIGNDLTHFTRSLLLVHVPWFVYSFYLAFRLFQDTHILQQSINGSDRFFFCKESTVIGVKCGLSTSSQFNEICS